MPRLRRSLLPAILFVLAIAGSAAADTGRVLVEGALVWNRVSGGAVSLQLGRGERVEIVRRVGEWYEVIVPQGRSPQRIGYVRAAQLEIITRGPLSPEARRIAATAPRAAVAPSGQWYLNADFAFRAGGTDFTRTSTAFADTYAEDGSITTNYGNGAGPLFDLMVTRALGARFGAGVAFSVYNRTESALISAEVPHPFFFGQPRTAEADSESIARSGSTTNAIRGREIGVHIPLSVVVRSDAKMRISAYGGPSIFILQQDVVADLELDDVYPYEAVEIAGYATAERRGTSAGFHVGADFSYFMNPRYGAGAGVRYSRAKLKFDADQGITDGKAGGGVQIQGGIRVRF